MYASIKRKTRKKNPDLIITDWDMPEMDGIEFLYAIKKEDPLKDIPVIMCSGVMTTSENLETALEAGAADYIRKPIDEIEFKARVRSMLNLSESYQQIKAINAYKDRILSIVTHDLRSAVGGVYSVVQLMQENLFSDQEEFERILSDAEVNIGSSYALLENLLTWARNQVETKKKQPEKLNISAVLNEVKQILHTAIQEKNITLNLRCPEGIKVYADERMTVSILQNLLANAVKFTPQDGAVEVHCEESDKRLIIKVKDNGIGISEADRKKILGEEYYTTADTQNRKGSGLGLQIARDFIQKHRSELTIESEKGSGSVFSFSLPLENAAD